MSAPATTASIATIVAVLFGGPAPAAAQTTAPRWDPDWQPPRTAWGHPDLQGNWTNATITPLERPASVDGLVLSREEVQTREQRVVDRVVAGSQPSDPDRPPPEVADDPGTYNQVWFDTGSRVAIVDGEARSSIITSTANGRRPPLTPEGQRRQEERRALDSRFADSDNPENRTLADRCLVSFGNHGGPPMTPNYGYNANYTIVQAPDHVMIHTEMVHDTRVIRLGEPDPLPEHIRPWFGDSWGRWEGNTLVIETTKINPLQTYYGIDPSPDMKVTERLTRVDEETILYEFTVDDPTTYTEPWGGELPFLRLDDQLYEYNCHEGNYAMTGILSGARYQERQSAGN